MRVSKGVRVAERATSRQWCEDNAVATAAATMRELRTAS